MALGLVKTDRPLPTGLPSAVHFFNRACPGCSTVFKTQEPTKHYCSTECARKARLEKRAAAIARGRTENDLTVNEAAKELGVTPARVGRLIALGILEAEKHGRYWWITPEAVERAKDRPKPIRRNDE